LLPYSLAKWDKIVVYAAMIALLLCFASHSTRLLYILGLTMSSTTEPLSPNSPLNLLLFAIPHSLLLQMGTASILMLVTAQKTANKTLEAMGQASEEIFRGDRLPIIDFPEQPTKNRERS
jgi:hypothetical protein